MLIQLPADNVSPSIISNLTICSPMLLAARIMIRILLDFIDTRKDSVFDDDITMKLVKIWHPSTAETFLNSSVNSSTNNSDCLISNSPENRDDFMNVMNSIILSSFMIQEINEVLKSMGSKER